jgi:hypothetical protein
VPGPLRWLSPRRLNLELPADRCGTSMVSASSSATMSSTSDSSSYSDVDRRNSAHAAWVRDGRTKKLPETSSSVGDGCKRCTRVQRWGERPRSHTIRRARLTIVHPCANKYRIRADLFATRAAFVEATRFLTKPLRFHVAKRRGAGPTTGA